MFYVLSGLDSGGPARRSLIANVVAVLCRLSATQSIITKVQILTSNGRFPFYWILCGPESGAPASRSRVYLLSQCKSANTDAEWSLLLDFMWAGFGGRASLANLAAMLCDPERADQVEVYLLYWYKNAGFTSTKVRMLTPKCSATQSVLTRYTQVY
jgi:hypothetical protein